MIANQENHPPFFALPKPLLQSRTVEQTGGYNFSIKGKKKKENSSLSNHVHNSSLWDFLVSMNHIVLTLGMDITFLFRPKGWMISTKHYPWKGDRSGLNNNHGQLHEPKINHWKLSLFDVVWYAGMSIPLKQVPIMSRTKHLSGILTQATSKSNSHFH